jgi:replicative DNA helicase
MKQIQKSRRQYSPTSRQQVPDTSSLVYGKVPPQSKDMEEAVLGAMMLGNGAFEIAAEILRPECFYVTAHQVIFQAIRQLAAKSMPVDILTVVEELKKSGELEQVGGPFYVTKLTNSVVSSANIEAHARIILQKYMQREFIRIGGELVSQGYEDTTDVFDLADFAESELFKISANHFQKDFQKLDKGLVKAMKRMDELRNREHDLTGVPTGYPELDKLTGGWQPTDLIIIAARPSVGKTAFALNLARNAAMSKIKRTGAAIFSLEMSSMQIVNRILSAESEIKMWDISNGNIDETKLVRINTVAVSKLVYAPIFIDDTPALNIFELRAKCRRLVNNHGVGLIIIDYLQLMTCDSKAGNREQEISKISRELKKLAKDLNVPVIALSQLSRDVEKRKGKPQLSDLRESGAIEQDADAVMFLYRPSEDDVKQDPMLKNTGEVLIRKHRNGELGELAFKVYHEIMKWMTIPDGLEYEARKEGSFIPMNTFSSPATGNNEKTFVDDAPF